MFADRTKCSLFVRATEKPLCQLVVYVRVLPVDSSVVGVLADAPWLSFMIAPAALAK